MCQYPFIDSFVCSSTVSINLVNEGGLWEHLGGISQLNWKVYEDVLFS